MKHALQGLEAQRLATLFVVGWLLLDFPLLRLWEGPPVFGMPRLAVALFVIWALLIGALAWFMERGEAPPPPGAAAADGEAPQAARD
jgi:hypothetical protein